METPTLRMCFYCRNASVYRCPACGKYLCDFHVISGEHHDTEILPDDLPTTTITDFSEALLFDQRVFNQLSKTLMPRAVFDGTPHVTLHAGDTEVWIARQHSLLFYRIINRKLSYRVFRGPYVTLKDLLKQCFLSDREIIYQALRSYEQAIKAEDMPLS